MSKKLGASYWKLWTATAISNLGDGVSMVAYPWLASAVTRSPILIAAAGFASRLPWLIFTLHAGVLTDRFDRRKLIVAMDFMRGLLTVFVGFVVFFNKDSFPALDELATITNLETNWPIYFTLLITAFLFGLAEVLRDNSAQTLMPSVVDKENLEKANGRMWSAESLTNSFIGPPLGSLLIGIAIFIPFFFDAVSFFFAVALIASLKGTFKPVADDKPREKINFKAEIKEGYAWLWAHPLLRPMAIILGSMNGLGTMVGATGNNFGLNEWSGNDGRCHPYFICARSVGNISIYFCTPWHSWRCGRNGWGITRSKNLSQAWKWSLTCNDPCCSAHWLIDYCLNDYMASGVGCRCL